MTPRTRDDPRRGVRRWTLLLLALAPALFAVHSFATSREASGEDGKPEFAGPDSCKKCHHKQHKSWKETGMAKTFESLKPGQAVEKKTKAKLDPNADYTKDPTCLKCHSTGFGTDSGHPDPKAAAPASAERAKRTEGVTCEACHGPGSLYGPFKKDHPNFKMAEIVALGATSPPKAEDCKKCHVKECPTMPADYAFDFEKAKKKDDAIHVHVPLKNPH